MATLRGVEPCRCAESYGSGVLCRSLSELLLSDLAAQQLGLALSSMAARAIPDEWPTWSTQPVCAAVHEGPACTVWAARPLAGVFTGQPQDTTSAQPLMQSWPDAVRQACAIGGGKKENTKKEMERRQKRRKTTHLMNKVAAKPRRWRQWTVLARTMQTNNMNKQPSSPPETPPSASHCRAPGRCHPACKRPSLGCRRSRRG